jgi:hypothetical protein
VPTNADGDVPMQGCGGPTTVATTLVKMRTLGADEALYAGKALAREGTRRCALVFDGGASSRTILGDIALGGGASETIVLGPRPRRNAD